MTRTHADNRAGSSTSCEVRIRLRNRHMSLNGAMGPPVRKSSTSMREIVVLASPRLASSFRSARIHNQVSQVSSSPSSLSALWDLSQTESIASDSVFAYGFSGWTERPSVASHAEGFA